MPELPEVEITRRHLAKAMTGAVLAEVSVTHTRTARHNSGPEELAERLTGRRVLEVDRTGKFIHAPLDDGQTFVTHLGMSGRYTVNGADEPHTHFRAMLDTGDTIRFIDPRTFGFVAVYLPDELGTSGVARLGPDSLLALPDPEMLGNALEGRTAPIKALLLDQAVISGLGNIYADEALYGARIHPLAPGGSLDFGERHALLEAVRRILADAIENGGTSLDDLAYLLPDGRAGENLDRLEVYGRTDQPCNRCGTVIERVVVRNRSSHFCPTCQRLGS